MGSWRRSLRPEFERLRYPATAHSLLTAIDVIEKRCRRLQGADPSVLTLGIDELRKLTGLDDRWIERLRLRMEHDGLIACSSRTTGGRMLDPKRGSPGRANGYSLGPALGKNPGRLTGVVTGKEPRSIDPPSFRPKVFHNPGQSTVPIGEGALGPLPHGPLAPLHSDGPPGPLPIPPPTQKLAIVTDPLSNATRPPGQPTRDGAA